MNKLSLALVATGLFVMPAWGQKIWNTQHYGTMQSDTLYHVSIGPGTTETRTLLHFNTSGDESTDFDASAYVNYLEIDLTDPHVTLKVARAGKSTKYGGEKSVKNIMAENTSYQNHYFAGVNGDFFGEGGTSCGYCVVDGMFAGGGEDGMSNKNLPGQFIIDKDGKPFIADEVKIGGAKEPGWMVHTDPALGIVTYPDGTIEQTVRINKVRYPGYLIAYNEMFWSNNIDQVSKEVGYTATSEWGAEASLKPADGKKMVLGEEIEYIVGATTPNGSGGNMKVPHGGLVLSGANCSTENCEFYNVSENGKLVKLGAVKSGDKLKISFPFTADGTAMTCRETVGAYPRLVSNGEAITSVPSDAPGDLGLTERRARTAVGYNEDKTKMYIFVVSEQSSKDFKGMTAKSLASFMQAVGCHEAVNLDGGGSSVLHVENLGHRSDVQGSWSYQRPVNNGLFCVTDAPETQEVARIEFVDKKLDIKPGRGYQPVIYAYNEYGVLVSTGLQNYTLSAPNGVATFDTSGRKMIAGANGYFALTATYNGITASIPVKITADGIEGSDPDTAPKFTGDEFVKMIEKPADWIDPNQPNIYLAGNLNGMKPLDPIIVHPASEKNGIYEFDIDTDPEAAASVTGFKFTTVNPLDNNLGWNAFKYGDNNGVGYSWHVTDVIAPGRIVSMVQGNNTMIEMPWSGKWHVTIDIINETIQATTETPRPAITQPEHLYMIGDIAGHAWDAGYTGAELTGTDGVYTITGVVLDGKETVSFAFTTATGNKWADIAAKNCFGSYTDGTTLSESDSFFASKYTWTAAPGKYEITLNFNTGIIGITPYISPEDRVYARLLDITPAGYNWDKYEAGATLKFTDVPTSATTGTWTAPTGIYTQEAFDNDGHVSAVFLRGIDLDKQDEPMEKYKVKNGFSIQDLGGYIGKCLVYQMQYGPGDNGINKGWPYSTLGGSTVHKQGIQLTLYPDKNLINKGDVNYPIRIRLVFQVLLRGRHTSNGTQIPSIYTSVWDDKTVKPTSHNGIDDNETGALFPITEQSFYRWENEGETIAQMPAEQINADFTGQPEPWDNNGTANKYHINSERFMVYEYDTYADTDGGIALHINITNSSWNTYIFKEIRFFNVLNGEEIAAQPRAKTTASRAAEPEEEEEDPDSFVTNTAYGSLVGTRHISYRYYTEDGIKEFDQPVAENGDDSGIENVIAGDENTPVEYYNLQGVRVNNPAGGIYIKKQGSTVSKIYIR